jgi:hypothetical protein
MSLLDSTLHALPIRDIVIVAADFNATLPTAFERVIYPVSAENDNTSVFTDFLVRQHNGRSPESCTLLKVPKTDEPDWTISAYRDSGEPLSQTVIPYDQPLTRQITVFSSIHSAIN